MATATGWTDENDNAEASRVMAALRKFSEVAGAVVVSVDHFGKNAEQGSRGASAKEANAGPAAGRHRSHAEARDTFSRYSPAIEPRFNFRGADVVQILEDVGRQLGSRRRSGSIKGLNSFRVRRETGKE